MYCPHCGGAISTVDWAALAARKLAGPWRHGNTLVARKNAVFPARCLKTNLPTTRFIHWNLTWMQPGYYALLLLMCVCSGFGLLVALIVMAVVTKRVVLHLPITDEVLALQRRTHLKCMIAFAALFIFFPLAQILDIALLFLVGALSLAGAVFVWNYSVRLISVQRIDRNYVYINGVCPEFLAELPDF